LKVAIIKYNAGNIHSVRLALNRIGVEPIVSDDPSIIAQADKVIFPGVGEARSAMKYLKNRKIENLLPRLTQPILGICLGLQLMCRDSEENNTTCLGIFDAKVKMFPAKKKIPHMGWNTIYDFKSSLFEKIDRNSYVYFVHSYYAELNTNTSAQSNYIVTFSSALHRNNFYAVQFHPEKSGKVGEKILKNFLSL
jgi:glutamine amidotransferase